MSTLRSRILSARDVEAAGETEEDMFCYIATPGGQSVQGGGGKPARVLFCSGGCQELLNLFLLIY